MAVLGLYTSKEVEQIKASERNAGYQEAEVKYEKEIKEIMDFDAKIITNKFRENLDLRKDVSRLSAELNKKSSKINALSAISTLEEDKKIKRLEKIAERTKKPRIKKKLDNVIAKYEVRKILREKYVEEK